MEKERSAARVRPWEPGRALAICLAIQVVGLAIGLVVLFVAVPHALPWGLRLLATVAVFGGVTFAVLRLTARIRLSAATEAVRRSAAADATVETDPVADAAVMPPLERAGPPR